MTMCPKDNRMKQTRLTSIVLILVVALSSCAVTPTTRFSEFYERPSHPESIDIVIDTLILSDIAGSAVGVDKAKNEEAMLLIEPAIKQSFADRGFIPNLAFHGNGTTFKGDEKTHYFYATDWTSTQEVYTGPVYSEQNQLWGSAEVQTFLHRLLDHAKDANKKPRKKERVSNNSSKKRRQLVPALTPNEIPAEIMSMPSNLIVFVNFSGTEVGKGKSIGTAVATGLLSAALTGGMYVHASAPVSGSHLEIIVFDKSKSSVVWHNFGPGQRYTHVSKGVETIMKAFPTVSGEQYLPVGKKGT